MGTDQQQEFVNQPPEQQKPADMLKAIQREAARRRQEATNINLDDILGVNAEEFLDIFRQMPGE